MKPCPFCAEEIQDAAIKCRFCGSALLSVAVASATDPNVLQDHLVADPLPEVTPPNLRPLMVVLALVAVVCVIGIGLGLLFYSGATTRPSTEALVLDVQHSNKMVKSLERMGDLIRAGRGPEAVVLIHQELDRVSADIAKAKQQPGLSTRDRAAVLRELNEDRETLVGFLELVPK